MARNRDESWDELDRLLVRSRPVASEKLVQSLGEMVRGSAPPRLRRAARRVFALAFTAVMLVVLASFGGIGYACTIGQDTVNVVKRIAEPNHMEHGDHSPAHCQYGPPPPPQCRKDEERVDGRCIPSCRKDEERVNGRCIPSCRKDEERVNGRCVPSCRKDEARVNGKCVKPRH